MASAFVKKGGTAEFAAMAPVELGERGTPEFGGYVPSDKRISSRGKWLLRSLRDDYRESEIAESGSV